MAGVIVGLVLMYLYARNSPDHFLGLKPYADAINSKVQGAIDSMKPAKKK